MAKVIFEVGDVFSWEEGYGVVVGDNHAVIITGKGERYNQPKITHGFIPPDAVPTDYEKLSYETQMAIAGARATVAALSIRDN